MEGIRETAYIVMRLDALALGNIGINGSLSQIGNSLKLGSFLGKYLDEFTADDFPLLFGIGYTFQFGEKTLCGIDEDQIGAQIFTEYLNNLLAFPFAHQTMINMDADKLLTDRSDEQFGHNR